MTIRVRRVVAACLGLALVAAGCGGSEPTDTTTPLLPPPGTSYSTSGLVYARSDTIAYGAEATSAPLVAGAAIGFGNATGTSGAGGSYSVAVTTTLVGDYLPVSASSAGYQPAWSPYLTYENARPVNVALYPEVAVTPRPGFVKGADFMDSGGGLQTILSAGRHAMVMDRVRDQDGANLVMSSEHLNVVRFRVATNTVVMTVDPFGVYSREIYQSLVAQAKAHGLKYMMTLALQSYAVGAQPADSVSQAEWRARLQISPTNDVFWEAFFAAFRPLVLERATIARDAGVEYLSFSGLEFLTRTSVARWQALVADIRALGYTGTLVYFWNPRVDQGIPEWNFADPALLRLFDVNGARMATVVARSTGSEVLARAQTRARMRSSVAATLDRMNAFGLPVILLVTVPSVHGGIVDPEFIEPCIAPSCGSTAPLRTRDFQQQADAYQAIAEVINATPTGPGRVAGLITAQFWYYDTYAVNQSAYDKGSNVRGKPAEMVLKWWFQRW
jgi:hypothetical protein